MAELPPMLAAPTAVGLARLAEEKRQAGRRAARARTAGYRAAVLGTLAEILEEGKEPWMASHADVWDLTPEQAASARRAMARVLRNRADNNGGRLGRA